MTILDTVAIYRNEHPGSHPAYVLDHVRRVLDLHAFFGLGDLVVPTAHADAMHMGTVIDIDLADPTHVEVRWHDGQTTGERTFVHMSDINPLWSYSWATP